MPVRMTHPRYGSRTVSDQLVPTHERAGWKAGAEVVASPVDGPMNKVLAAVGDDPSKARAAVAAEQSRSKPRKNLVTALTRVIESAADTTVEV